MKPTSLTSHKIIERWAAFVVVAILVLVPFHAVLSTWAGSNFGHLDLFRIWKELLMLPLASYCFWALWHDRTLARQLAGSWLVRLSLLYMVWFIGFGLLAHASGSVNTQALLYSWITNLRLVAWLGIVWVVTARYKLVLEHWRPIVLWPAAAVVFFGLLQRFILPADVLRHVGYGPTTIPATETVDHNLAFRRIQSTLRGANPLGAYLIVALATAITSWRRRLSALLIIGAAIVLFCSYSRSAWVGAVVMVAVLLWWQLSRRLRVLALVIGLAGAVLLVGLVWQFRHNTALQNTVFHTSSTSQSTISSNEAHGQAIQQGLRDVWHQPLGRGPGTAGPASFRNNHPARIAENYYVQLVQEVGLLGAGLFVAINCLLAWQLWQRRNHQLAKVLLASLAGIAVANMLLPAWTDDTLAILWWGLAGAAMVLPVISTKAAILNKEQTKWASKHTSKRNNAAS